MKKITLIIIHFLVDYPKSLLLSLVVLSLLAIIPASQIDTNFDLEEFFPKNDSTLIEYQKVSDLFGRDDNTFIIAFNHQKFDKDILTKTDSLSKRFSKIDGVSSVNSIIETAELQVVDQEIRVEPFFEINQDVSKALDTFQKNVIFKNTFLSTDADFSIMLVSIEQDYNNYSNRKKIIAQLNTKIEDYYSNENYFITGIPFFRTQYVDYLNSEILIYIGLGTILIISLLWYIYRNIKEVLIPILIVWLTLLFTVAIMYLTGGFFEIMSSTIAPILLCVGIGDSVHMLSKYNDTLNQPLTRRERLSDTIKTMGLATLLTSVTTAIGFGSLVVSNVLPMKRFGIYTAVGVIVAFIATITFLPSFVQMFKGRKESNYNIRFDTYLKKVLTRVGDFVQNKYKSIIVVGFLITLIVSVGAFKLKINSKVYDDIGENSVLIQNLNKIGVKINPVVSLDFIIDSGEPEGVFDSEIHKDISKVESILKKHSVVKNVRSISDVLSDLHIKMSEQETSYYESDDLTANYLFLLELSDSDTYSKFIDFEQRYIRVTAFMNDIGSNEVNNLRTSLSREFKNEIPNRNITISGSGVLVADLAINLVYSLNSSIILALILIGIIMFILFKNPFLTIISLIPNIFPLLLTAGIMGFLNIDLKPSTAVIFTIAFGIAVDDSIHFLARFRIESNNSNSKITAIRTTLLKTGKSIILTSLILLLGFGVLVTSNFESTLYMGLLTCFTILSAVIYDLFLLPSLLIWYYSDFQSNKIDHTKVIPQQQYELPRESPQLVD